jgi:hypothetical protein
MLENRKTGRNRRGFGSIPEINEKNRAQKNKIICERDESLPVSSCLPVFDARKQVIDP